MMQRGQKIIVLESSASKRGHPAVGDVGYLSNMYLFFKDRFILLDAFFFSYKSDPKTNRCERKRFIIDLGMKDNFRYKLRSVGIPKKFFTQNLYVANLTPAAYRVIDGSYMELPNINSMWLRTNSNKGRKTSDECIKIPYGQIALAPGRKVPINTEGKNTFICWARCLIPLLIAEIDTASWTLQDDITNISTICNIATREYNDDLSIYIRAGSKLGGLTMRPDRNVDLSIESSNKIIKSMRMIQVLSGFLLDNCDRRYLKSLLAYNERIRLISKSPNSLEGLTDYSGLPTWVSIIMSSIFFRHIIMPGDTKRNLFEMKKMGYLSWGDSTIINKAKKLDEIKLEANSDSTALNRIFER